VNSTCAVDGRLDPGYQSGALSFDALRDGLAA
jgi:hypothetical protein